MCLGLLVDLGLDPAQLESDLRALPIAGWQLAVRPNCATASAGRGSKSAFCRCADAAKFTASQ